MTLIAIPLGSFDDSTVYSGFYLCCLGFQSFWFFNGSYIYLFTILTKYCPCDLYIFTISINTIRHHGFHFGSLILQIVTAFNNPPNPEAPLVMVF